MLLHHLKRALIVLLLELSFRAEHMPADAAELLTEAKAAVNWLRHIGFSSPSAKHTWVTLSRLLHQAAQKVGGDTADIATSPEDPMAAQEFGMDFRSGDGFSPSGAEQPSGAYDPNDPKIFPPLGLNGGFPQGQGGQCFGDLAATSEWDEFGFLRAEGGMDNLFGQQDHHGMQQMGHQMDLQQQQVQSQSQGPGPGQGQGGKGQRQHMPPMADEQN